ANAVEDACLRHRYGGRTTVAQANWRAVDRGDGRAGLAGAAVERIGKDEAQERAACQPEALSREAVVGLHGSLLGKSCASVRDADWKRRSVHCGDVGAGGARIV